MPKTERVGLIAESLEALIGGWRHMPHRTNDAVANQLMRRAWELSSLLHAGKTVRLIVPRHGLLAWLRPKVIPFFLPNDPYASPAEYAKALTSSGDLDRIIEEVSTTGASAGPPTARQYLSCLLVLDPDNHTAVEAYAQFEPRVDAINRLIQFGYSRVSFEADGCWFEHRSGSGSPWVAL